MSKEFTKWFKQILAKSETDFYLDCRSTARSRVRNDIKTRLEKLRHESSACDNATDMRIDQ